jgi:hypothetical protein
MKDRSSSICVGVCLAIASQLGCVGEGAPPTAGGDGGPLHTGAVLPWKEGNRWTYRVTDDTGVTTKVTTIQALEPVGLGPHMEVMAYKVETKKQDGMDTTISWQAPVGDVVVRYREQSYALSTGMLELEEYWDPSKLHIDGSDEHTKAGAKWVQQYTETKVPVTDGVLGSPSPAQTADAWQVLDAAEDRVAVTVPAGTFDDPIIFQKAGGSSLKTYWYVRGIGKVKETGGQTEELVSYELAP